MEGPQIITPVYLDGRYEPHMLIPFINRWDGLGDEELRPNQQEFMLPESYYRAIGDDYNFPETIDPDGGPFMSIGYKFKDLYSEKRYRIDRFDCRGKYPILICSKLPSSTT
jgi:hypothetical protein